MGKKKEKKRHKKVVEKDSLGIKRYSGNEYAWY